MTSPSDISEWIKKKKKKMMMRMMMEKKKKKNLVRVKKLEKRSVHPLKPACMLMYYSHLMSWIF
jgi:hypothetical protein